MPQTYRPLRDVRVLAFESAFSLPAGTRTLSDLGAEVVRVGRPDPVAGPYTTQVDGGRLNKSAVSINLQAESGRELTRKLAGACDVICNNFRPRVLRRFGLTYQALSALNPRLIFLQLSGYGGPGPWEDFPAYGPSVEAAGGMNYLMGEEDDVPMRVGSGVYADQAGGRYSAFAIMAALEQRRLSGRGQLLDVSMYESIIHLTGEQVLAASMSGQRPPRQGNRDPNNSPQGVYPCAGDDQWVAISIQDDRQWRALRMVIGAPDLDDEVLGTVEGRRARQEAIDRGLSRWTSVRGRLQAAEELQAAGIPAAPVEMAQDAPLNPQMISRGAFQTVRHAQPILGYMGHPHLTLPWRIAGRARPELEDMRPDDADNLDVLQRWLGLGAADVEGLLADGGLLPASEFTVRGGERGAEPDPHFGERLGLKAGV